jgi:NAD(P)-dependent dehydrogenase (short-subunit alcohol dehydrogenase family)
MSEPTIASSLKGRRIVITGAAAGIGRATALLFAAAGAQVALLDYEETGLAATATDSNAAIAVKTDVSDEAEVAHAIAASAEAMKGIDGVVNIAGVNWKQPLGEMSLESWRRVMDINLTGTFLVCRAALPMLRKEKSATIVNMASGAALVPWGPDSCAYNASKGAVIAFSKSLAIELGPNIRVNAICPGAVETVLFTAANNPELRARIAANYAVKRIAEADEIAQAIAFLTSDQSSFVTGTALAVDGGRTYH